ncbi:DoxX family protein [Halobaculum limi]|uniref:DoxX family protein n=1 Tax=Halobaculum limi TaxID=3031916 RepID=UPI002404C78F|nr:DoxX-like family protein [Halobaculum sp. YSMS11]
MGPIYVIAGVSHFLVPKAFERVVPPSLPRPRALVYLSGLAEIALGIGVLLPQTRRRSAWGLIVLLVAVFPANVYMATGDVEDGLPEEVAAVPDWLLWARLPMQAVLIAWAWWYTDSSDDQPK